MKKKTKTLILSIVVTLILLLTFTVTYAVFTYQGTTSNQQLVLGDIYMHYTESNAISISGALPGDPYDSSDPNNYFEFTISGKNTYKQKDIYYDVILSRGETPDDKTEANRIGDEYLKFRLVEVNEDDTETELFTDKTYSDLTNKRIWVETISKNTTTEYNKTYRIYMVISENLIIGNTTDSVMTTEAYKDAFASVKVNVTGDFNEKVLTYEDMYNVTDASCFETTSVYKINSNMTDAELSSCVTYFKDYWGVSEEDEVYERFCTSNEIISGYTFQSLIEVTTPNTLNELSNLNLIQIDESNVSITSYDASCGSDVVIPRSINNKNVTRIGFDAFYNKNINSLILSDTIVSIGPSAFSWNSITNLIIPDSVERIFERAFYNNSTLTTLTLGKNVQFINIKSFVYTNLTEVIIPESVIQLDCNAFDSDVNLIKRDDLVCGSYGDE